MSARPKKLLTLCYLIRDDEVLLGMKKRGFGAGRWNGFGGKLHPGETLEQATVREVAEEAGIEVTEMSELGQLDFEFQNQEEILEVHVFKIKSYSGDPAESEEMRPQWFKIAEIPYGQMWPSDPLWFPLFFAGRRFSGWFLFDKKGDKVLNYHLVLAV